VGLRMAARPNTISNPTFLVDPKAHVSAKGSWEAQHHSTTAPTTSGRIAAARTPVGFEGGIPVRKSHRFSTDSGPTKLVSWS
jgi:hypothetical protein